MGNDPHSLLQIIYEVALSAGLYAAKYIHGHTYIAVQLNFHNSKSRDGDPNSSKRKF